MAKLTTFAVGDIHGCLDKLETLLALCDLVRSGRDTRFVFIGDYVDRGPDTRRVMEFLIRKQTQEGDRFVCLRGNHEEMLTGAADKDRTDRSLMDWWVNSGEQTLDSFGISEPSALTTRHLTWIKALPLRFSDKKRLYVHAGIRASVSVD